MADARFHTRADHKLMSSNSIQPAIAAASRNGKPRPAPEIFKLSDLRDLNPTLNPPVVEGLLREGETANIIADSKSGKSWLGYSLAWSIVTGRNWLGKFTTTPGNVLLIDNELHRSTLAHRIPAVAKAMGIDHEAEGDAFEVWPMRGQLASLAELAADLESIEPETYRLILLDAKYRFVAPGASESDNADETRFYNLIDQIAERTKAAIVLIHHNPKGDQSGKKVTDLGSGAGAQSRAADCHLVLRPHETPGVAVLEAAVRSFAPVEPLPLLWRFPLWQQVDGVDTTMLKGRRKPNEERQSANDKAGIMEIVDALRKEGPATAKKLLERTGLGRERLRRLLGMMRRDSQVTVQAVTIRGNECDEYSLPKAVD